MAAEVEKWSGKDLCPKTPEEPGPGLGCLLGASQSLTGIRTGPLLLPRAPRSLWWPQGWAVTCYQVHGVHLDGVLLGVPLGGHSNGQGLAGDSEELALGRPQLPVVQVDLKATLKDQMETSQVDRQSGVITPIFSYLI